MAKRRSVMSLVQSYIDGQGSETSELLGEINNAPQLPVATSSTGSSTGSSTNRQAGRQTGKQDDRITDNLLDKQVSSVANRSTSRLTNEQAGSETGTQVDTQANSVVGSVADNQTVSLTDSITDRQIGTQAGSETGSLTDSVAGNHTDEQTDSSAQKQDRPQADKQVDKQDGRNDDTHNNQQVVEQEAYHAIQHIPQQAIRRPVQQAHQQAVQQVKMDKRAWMPLTKNQGQVLMFLYEYGGGLTNTDIIGVELAMPYGTIRSAISVLISEGYVTDKQFFSGHAFKGFTYSLNNNLVSAYVNRVRQAVQQVNQHTLQQAVHQSYQFNNQQAVQQTDRQGGRQADRLIEEEVSLNKNLTSSETVISTDGDKHLSGAVLSGIDLTTPELKWWVSQGLTIPKTIEWLRQFEQVGLTEKDLTQSLKYAWFDADVNKVQPSARPIDKPLSWFFAFLPGGYPAPSNYKTCAQLQIEQEKKELEEMEREQQELADLRRRKRKAELELKFMKILVEAGDEYKGLLTMVDNEFAKEMGGDTLDDALKEKYFEKNGFKI